MNSDTQSFNVDLQTIRERPAMFLCPVSVSALWHFILGYGLGQSSVSADAKSPFALPSDFHDWVAYRLHFFESTTGWHNMIVKRLGDGPHALAGCGKTTRGDGDLVFPRSLWVVSEVAGSRLLAVWPVRRA